MLKGIIQYSHHLLNKSIHEGESVIDATCGNGNDTLFLSEIVGDQGKVFAFDIQEQAIKNTRQLVAKHNRQNVHLIHDSHAHIENHISQDLKGKIGGAIFNLGYLPRSDKSIITQGETTIMAIDSILQYLKKNGLIVLVVYHGHEGGKEEKKQVLSHVVNLDQKKYHVLKYGFINQQNNPPFIVAIHKK